MRTRGIQGVSAHELARRVRAQEISALTLVRQTLETIEASKNLGIWLRVASERALEAAERIDERVAAGEDPGPLAGVPFAVKDNLHLAGVPTTCASRILEGFCPREDAVAVARLIGAGAIPVGKVNLDEFGMGAGNETGAFGPCRNPLDPTRVAGGSSGGAAAAVALGQVPLALGSDTGGSIRLPAAYCGVFGIKPGYGSVSRRGLVAFASSLDQVGPLAGCVADLALALEAMIAQDPGDRTTAAPMAVPGMLRQREDLSGIRLGVVRQWSGSELSRSCSRSFQACLRDLEALGAETTVVDLPILEHAAAVYHLISSAEASSNLARYDGIRFGLQNPEATSYREGVRRVRGRGFGREVKQRILLGTFALSQGRSQQWLEQAQKVRRRLQEDLLRSLEGVDLLIGATTAGVAPRVGSDAASPTARNHRDQLTCPANLAGLPALSLPSEPCSETGMPLGVQMVAGRSGEFLLLEVADCLQRKSHRGGFQVK